MITGSNDREIKYLGPTSPGSKHDKKMADEEEIEWPVESVVYRDLGFQGYEMGEGVIVFEPKKKPRNGELTQEEKESNREISSIRIIVEHVISGIKRCRCLKDTYRNWKVGFDDTIIEIACGLHNLRNSERNISY